MLDGLEQTVFFLAMGRTDLASRLIDLEAVSQGSECAMVDQRWDLRILKDTHKDAPSDDVPLARLFCGSDIGHIRRRNLVVLNTMKDGGRANDRVYSRPNGYRCWDDGRTSCRSYSGWNQSAWVNYAINKLVWN